MQDDQQKTLYLCAVVYHGENHFTSRVITSEDDVWFNNGRVTEKQCEYEGKLQLLDHNHLNNFRNKILILAVYSET